MSIDCDERADVWSERIQRARKQYQCGSCAEPIQRGHLYGITASLYEGRWETVRRCARCESMYSFLQPLCWELPDDTACAPRLDCGHTYLENFGKDAPLAVQALAFLTPDEAQVLLSAPKLPGETEEQRIERVVASLVKRSAAE